MKFIGIEENDKWNLKEKSYPDLRKNKGYRDNGFWENFKTNILKDIFWKIFFNFEMNNKKRWNQRENLID
jgi:hypothetical protein